MTFNREEAKKNGVKSIYVLKKSTAPVKKDHFKEVTKFVTVKEEFDFERSENIVDFPLSIFPEHIQDYINKLYDTLKYEKSVVAASILFTVAVSVGNQKKIQVKRKWETNPNLWIAVVGRKGTAKSHMMKAAIDPLLKADKASNEAFKMNLRNWMSLNAADKEVEAAPIKKKFITNDVTVEGLLKALVKNPNGLGLFKDELRGFYEDMNRYSSNSVGFWLSVYNGGSWEKERAVAETPSVDDICISILGSIQPSVLNELACNNTDNGMIDRWLYVQSNNIIQPKTLDDITEEEEHNYEVFINDILHGLGNEKYVAWEKGSIEEWLSCSNLLSSLMEDEDYSTQLQEYFSKLDVYFPRFILLIAIMNKSNTIEVAHVKKAFDLVTYFIKSARNIFTSFENIATFKAIFAKTKAKTKQQMANALLIYMPSMTKKEIAKEVSCSLDTVYKAEKKLHQHQ